MSYGKILTYRDIEEAKKLIGKIVVCSEHLQDIREIPNYLEKTILKDISLGRFFANGTSYQFIREVIEEPPEYKPFNWEEAQGVLGRIVHRKRGTYAYGEYEQFRVVTSVNLKAGGEVQIMGLTAEKFLKLYEFADGKPCGVEVEE